MRSIKLLTLLLTVCLLATPAVQAQDTLPRFSVRNAGNNRFVVSWVNPFPNMAQISIQRSFDSLGTYKTILSVADPKSVQNGFTDRTAPNDHMFYRLFYVLDGGLFYFTRPKRPDTSRIVVPVLPRPSIPTVLNTVPAKYRDSIFVRNRDTFVVINRDTIAVKPKAPIVPKWVPSRFVFTNGDGYVTIRLPDADKENYTIRIFEDSTRVLFELKGVKEKSLTLDKGNFYHAGWYFFELYNDEKLVERNKFFLKP
ncbi:MAG: hypothetical protein EOO11_17365 [Chitinophagaceae bacterium]|nr:MAG: hypothetical protein EOO11_17365 [Chitinophagaceae bacterium]